jgi:stage IV sporulation protein FB
MDEFIGSEEQSNSSLYPEKPQQKIFKLSLQRSIVSMLLFIAAFYFFFNWKIESIIILTIVILIHEYGHYLAMKMYDYKELSIFFLPLLGAATTGSKENISQRQSVIVLFAGPLPGIVFGCIIYYFLRGTDNLMLLKFAKISIILNAFNLIPVIPLDGGRIIKNLFFGTNEIISNIFAFLSIGVISYYAIANHSYVLLVFPYFMLMSSINRVRILKVRKKLIESGLNLNRSYSELTDEEYWKIRDEIGNSLPEFKNIIIPGTYEYSEKEQQIMGRVLLTLNKKPLNDVNGFWKFIYVAIMIVAFSIPAFIIFKGF